MALPPDLRFGLAIALLGVVMLTLPPQAAVWIGVLLVLAALTYAEKDARKTGHSFIADLRTTFGLAEVK